MADTGNERLAVGLFLRSGNVLERQGLMGKKHGRQASTGDWIFQLVLAACQPPFNLYHKGCVLEGSVLIGNQARKGLNSSTRAQVLSQQPLPSPSSPSCSHSSADLDQPRVRLSHRAHTPFPRPSSPPPAPPLQSLWWPPKNTISKQRGIQFILSLPPVWVSKCSHETFSALRNWSWSGGRGNGLLLQEPGSKASSSTSFTPRNSKYCLSTHSAELSLETCNRNSPVTFKEKATS